MNLQTFFIFQLIADLALCLALVSVLYLFTREGKKTSARIIDPAVVSELKRMLDASQQATDSLIKAMDDSRKALKETAYSLDERENRLRSLILEADEQRKKQCLTTADTAKEGDRYADILEMARQGVDAEEIVRISGLPRGEVDLIVGLDRQKNETR